MKMRIQVLFTHTRTKVSLLVQHKQYKHLENENKMIYTMIRGTAFAVVYGANSPIQGMEYSQYSIPAALFAIPLLFYRFSYPYVNSFSPRKASIAKAIFQDRLIPCYC